MSERIRDFCWSRPAGVEKVNIHNFFVQKLAIAAPQTQAVIKSALSAASQKTKSRGAPRPPSSASRAAIRHSTGAWSPGFGLRGGCASSRLDHGLKVELTSTPNSLNSSFWPRLQLKNIENVQKMIFLGRSYRDPCRGY